jgi:hypothetical protein
MKKNDIYLICGIILLIACSFLLIRIFRSEGSRVLIMVDGKEHKEFDLNDNITYEILHDDGEFNVIEIRDGYVRMVEASCPDKLCVKHNKIHYNYESITCLPNRVYVRIVGGEESELDAVAE